MRRILLGVRYALSTASLSYLVSCEIPAPGVFIVADQRLNIDYFIILFGSIKNSSEEIFQIPIFSLVFTY